MGPCKLNRKFIIVWAEVEMAKNVKVTQERLKFGKNATEDFRLCGWRVLPWLRITSHRRVMKGHNTPPCSARGGRAQEGRNRSPYGKAKSRPAHRPAAKNPMETAPVTRTRPVHGHGLLCVAWLAGVTKPPPCFPLFCMASSFPLISCRPSTLLISRSSELQK